MEFNQRSENLCHERSASPIYFFDSVQDIMNRSWLPGDLYKPFLSCLFKTHRKNALARQKCSESRRNHQYTAALLPNPPLPHPLPPSNLHYLPATLRYCHVQLSPCVLPKLLWRQVYFAGCRVHVAGWNLIITEKRLALKIINNLYTRRGFLHKVVRLFHVVKTRCY